MAVQYCGPPVGVRLIPQLVIVTRMRCNPLATAWYRQTGVGASIHAEIAELYHAPSGAKVDAEGAIESGGQGHKTIEHTVIGAGAGALLGGIWSQDRDSMNLWHPLLQNGTA